MPYPLSSIERRRKALRRTTGDVLTTSKRQSSRGFQDQTANSAFLALPGEMRNTIYELVIADSPTAVVLRGGWIKTTHALNRVCRQIHKEFRSLVKPPSLRFSSLKPKPDWSRVRTVNAVVFDLSFGELLSLGRAPYLRNVKIRLIFTTACRSLSKNAMAMAFGYLEGWSKYCHDAAYQDGRTATEYVAEFHPSDLVFEGTGMEQRLMTIGEDEEKAVELVKIRCAVNEAIEARQKSKRAEAREVRRRALE